MKEVILLGNPNVGKTTLFNSLTKANEHTGNWHGVTVDSKGKIFEFNKEQFKLVDLPGIYSLTPLSFEEKVAVEYLFLHKDCLVVNIVDSQNLYRNLYLTLELIELKIPTILVVNETKLTGKQTLLNCKKLEEKLGVKVIKFNTQKTNECEILKQEIYDHYFNKNVKKVTTTIKNCEKIEILKQKVANLIKDNQNKLNVNENFVALKCLENDENIIQKLNLNEEQKTKLKQIQKEILLEEIIADKYKQVEKVLNEVQLKNNNNVYGKSKLDKFVLNKWLCLPIFLFVLLAIFYLTFFSIGKSLSVELSNFIQNVFGEWLLNIIKGITTNEIIYDFFASAIVGGLGSIFSFLPQVIILFVCLGVLEDSGYLSRVAFSLDDIFSKVGLSGKSVYTLLMGFGCSTSACLTARTMENKNAQIKTAMLAPYMSCSAKLPIYAVIGSAFFGVNNVFIILAMYLLGVVIALLLSVFYEKTFLKSGKQTFILEFPPYRPISCKRLIKIATSNTKMFLIRVGSLLFSVNIIVWILSSFSFTFGFVKLTEEQSIIESVGKILAPIFAPLGFNSWGATSALVAGLIAKEIIVSTIGIINGISPLGENFYKQISSSLTNLASIICFTPASAISYMVFCLLYSPCFATLGVLFKEVGKKWTIISSIIQFFVAYSISLILYNSINLILNKGIILFLALFITIFILTIFIFNILIKKKKLCKNCLKCGK